MQNKAYTYSVAILSLIILAIACTNRPKGVLSEKQMQAVLTDMQIAEAILSVDSKNYTDSGYKEALYESVFKKHNITQATYDSSIVWYGQNLDIYMKVYDKVKTDIEAQIKGLGNIQATPTGSSRSDSVNIWLHQPYLVLQPKAVFNGVVFDIKPERNYPSGSIFVLTTEVFGITDRMQQKPQISLTAIHPDTTITINQTIEKDGIHNIILRTAATKQVRKVHGYIRMDNPETDYHKIYLDSITLIRYNYGTKIGEEAIQAAREAAEKEED